MRIEGYLYTWDHKGGCEDCGGQLIAANYCEGYRTDPRVTYFTEEEYRKLQKK